MRKLILYGGRYGAAKAFSNRLMDQFEDADSCNIEYYGGSFEDYDTIIIGTSTYMGKLHPKIIKLLVHHHEIFMKKNLFIYVCGFCKDEYPSVIAKYINDEIIKHCSNISFIGGALNVADVSFFDKLDFKMLNKRIKVIDKVKADSVIATWQEATIKQFIQDIKKVK